MQEIRHTCNQRVSLVMDLMIFQRIPAWRGVQIWNTVHPEQTIDLPGRVMQIRITPLTDYSYLQEEYPVVYERIKDIFENKVNLLGSKYDGNSKMKSTQKDVLDIICIPYQLEKNTRMDYSFDWRWLNCWQTDETRPVHSKRNRC